MRSLRRATVLAACALVPAMAVPALAAAAYFVLAGEGAVARWGYAGAKVFLLVWPAFAVPVILRRPLPRGDLRSPAHLRALPAGFLSGAVLGAVILLAAWGPLREVARVAAPAVRAKVAGLGLLEYYWQFALFLSLVHSLLEEYYWRWFVYGNLRRVLPLAPALVLASAAFASHHVIVLGEFVPGPWPWVAGGAVALAGASWCLLFERQRTLAGAWASHLVADLAVMTLGWHLLKTA